MTLQKVFFEMETKNRPGGRGLEVWISFGGKLPHYLLPTVKGSVEPNLIKISHFRFFSEIWSIGRGELGNKKLWASAQRNIYKWGSKVPPPGGKFSNSTDLAETWYLYVKAKNKSILLYKIFPFSWSFSVYMYF